MISVGLFKSLQTFFEKDLAVINHPRTFAPTLRGRAEVARRAHNPKVRGSNPLLATKEKSRQRSGFFV